MAGSRGRRKSDHPDHSPGGGGDGRLSLTPPKLTEFPGAAVSTGLIAFSKDWQLGQSQQANFVLSSHIRNGLTADLGYVWGKGTHLARSRDINPPDSGAAAGFLFGGGTQQELMALNFFRPVPQVSEVMSFEGSACSSYHGMRLALRGRVGQRLSVNSSYTFSKAIDDAEEIFPHSRAQDMHNLRAERGLALYDQRQRFVFAAVLDLGETSQAGSLRRALQNGWTIAPMLELGSGRPLNILLGYDNNLDQESGSDRPHVVLGTEPGAVWTQYGGFAVPPAGVAGNLGRNAVVGPGYASCALRLQKKWKLGDRATAALVVDGLNIFNRTNVRASNPNFQHAGEPVAAFDPRQIQIGLRLEF